MVFFKGTVIFHVVSLSFITDLRLMSDAVRRKLFLIGPSHVCHLIASKMLNKWSTILKKKLVVSVFLDSGPLVIMKAEGNNCIYKERFIPGSEHVRYPQQITEYMLCVCHRPSEVVMGPALFLRCVLLPSKD